MNMRADSGNRVPAWLYVLAGPTLIGGLWASSLFALIYAAFGPPHDAAEWLEAALLVGGPLILALLAVFLAQGLWQGDRRRSATAVLGFTDMLVLLIAARWSQAI